MNLETSTLLRGKLALPATALLAALTLGFAPPIPTKPFRANFATLFTSVANFPIVEIDVVGAGHALHMGATAAFTDNQMSNLITGVGTATYELTAANGDTVIVELIATNVNTPSGVAFAGTYEITGGTGRFDDAGGTGSMSGTATFTGPTMGFGTFALDGTITY
jgi:hypothetical protein